MQEDTPKPQASAEGKTLKTLLQYQQGSVVSHVLLKSTGGTVTLFAFAKGEGLSEHTAPFDALVTIIEGKAEIKISGQEYQLNEGETLLMPANQPHSVQAISDFKMLLIMIKV